MLQKILAMAVLLQTTISFAGGYTCLSLEEKVGQLLLVHFSGETVSEEAKRLIREIKVGGIIYFSWANGLNSVEQVKNLSRDLQMLARENTPAIPLWIAVDQEGGVVGSLKGEFTTFPGNKALAETKDPGLSREVGLAIGKELSFVGINMNFAPVVDVNVHPRNPTIGLRSFGKTAEEVIVFANEMIEGFHEAGICMTLKHFPGHGDVQVDSHDTLPLVSKTRQELDQVELLPFAKLSAKADAVMTAHILVPALDASNCATFSSAIIGQLRQEIGFSGLVISDSLIMKGALAEGISVEEAAIKALNSGCDLLILGGKLFHSCEQCELGFADVQRVHAAIVQAVKQGRLSEARIDEAVERSLCKKKQYLASFSQPDFIEWDKHKMLAQKVANKALSPRIRKPVVLHGKNIGFFAPSLLQKDLQEISISQKMHFCGLHPTEVEMEECKAFASEVDVLFICSYNAWKNSSQILWIQSLIQIGKPVVLWVARDPLDADLFPEVDEMLLLYSPTFFSLKAARDLYELPEADLQSFSFEKDSEVFSSVQGRRSK